MPGYWNKNDAGWDWVQGFWGDGKLAGKPQYLPAPPASTDDGPAQPAPGDDSFYIPGSWVYQNHEYVWRPGFWYQSQPGWVYIPPHYNYTPAGDVYVDGYWDYPFADRGVLYAPVVFNQPWWNNPGLYYSPTASIGFGADGPWGAGCSSAQAGVICTSEISSGRISAGSGSGPGLPTAPAISIHSSRTKALSIEATPAGSTVCTPLTGMPSTIPL